ncbi:putative DNA binding domain-containing protein [Mediterraneibacter glycyrrhizinilyticus]|uniref:RNA-binding domain-containing protein n=1 Tax=Mediterraneibacter glycyrrhizinilyticus TaxID=342942 RepID=UPI001D05F913|nr:RNA-binding domain-containing protein [Mediterraneibacter glycyrrhizinilyticus]MCB6308344.1 putative DNA binding domain-containing protein [Lachnospiraceae bacterium 210521-DFI.1.109]MCB6426648.1 putative DNA binding domain-containing protein [Mediterraneibacter glycyrrhizinilyticus]
MTIEEILTGESKNVEFKENLPEKSIKYMKSVVAFANGTGGKIIFGIADKTREVVGFDKEDVFKKMDAIANAISDSCEPAIIPDITLQTVDGKTVIVVEVSEGRQRPYYIKALGRDGGVYVRVAGTTRLADEYMIKELLFEGSNRYYDQALCTGVNVTDEDIDALCKAMKEQAVQNACTEEQKASIKDVGRQQLRSWGILIERDGKDYPSNAFAILTGNGGLHVATQCGVFKGTTKAVFVDRREYTGPLWEQIDEAFQFVLRNIHLGATIVGIYRQDIYEIPPDAIRELIINAMVHRSYLDHGTIQVAVYDNRLEITSPGKLPMGQTMERMKEGYSKIRNEALAHAFAYMNLIEHWGSGIPRIIDKVKAAGLREPEFIGGEVDLRINIYRGQDASNDINNANKVPDTTEEQPDTANKVPDTMEKMPDTTEEVPDNEQEQQIYKYVSEKESITTAETVVLLGVKDRRARAILMNMVEGGYLVKEGAARSTIYVKNTKGR